MPYAAVNAIRSPQKATNWSGNNKGKSSKEIRLTGYQSIGKRHLYVYVKFACGLSTPFTRKMRSNKVKLFQGDGLSFPQLAGFDS
jgi:hypothetical protein